MCAAAFEWTMATTTTHEEDNMALIRVTVIAGVFTALQKEEIIERLTDAMVAIEGENVRQTIWCIVEEVASGEWGVGGRPLTADDVRALASATPIRAHTGSEPR